MIRFACATAMGAAASSSLQSASVVASSSSGAAMRLAKPIDSASSAPRKRPVMISSFARPTPTTAGSREQPPTSGISPIFTSRIAATASSAITRMSAASASSIAPPMHPPWICAIVGLGISSSRFHHSRIGVRNSRSDCGDFETSCSDPRSIPDENIGPLPRTTTTRTESSAAASSNARPVASISSPLKALRFSGRLRTTWRTAPRSSISTNPITSKRMDIEKVGVAGGGLMGHGIAQVAAQAGYQVVLKEVDQGRLDKAVGSIEKQLARAVEKGKLEQSAADEIRGRLAPTTDNGDFADCGLVIEAITENLELKREFWNEIDGIVKDQNAVFATNTSSLSVIDQAVSTERPNRFIGLHFFNPAQVMPLLEVVRTVTTDDDAFEAGLSFGHKVGKTVVRCKDKTGFIVNRLLVPYMLDAIRAFEEGTGTIEEIDTAMKGGAAHPMGPFTLLDFVGLDTTASIADIMFDEYREKRFAAPPTLRKLVAAGYYGKKSGRGFYDYSGEKPVAVDPGV